MLGWKVFGSGVQGLAVQAICQDAQSALVAAGTTQGTALELVSADSEIGTVASGAGVVLSSLATPGDTQTIYNAGVNPLKVYPPVGKQINGLGTNNPMLLAINTGCLFKFVSSTRVFGVLSA